MERDEQMQAILTARLKDLRDERAEVQGLLDTARAADAKGTDPKRMPSSPWTIVRSGRKETQTSRSLSSSNSFRPRRCSETS